MALLRVRYHPEAIAETERAIDWYAERSHSAALAFAAEFDRSVEEVRTFPEASPSYRLNCRRKVLARFPFSIIYRVTDNTVEVVAVTHHKKRPGYWTFR